MITTRAKLRRALVARQGLLGARASGGISKVLAWIREQGFLPLDGKTQALAPGHDLALFNRVAGFETGDLDLALYDGDQLFEHLLHVQGALPARDYPLIYDPEAAKAVSLPGSLGARVLECLAAEGPASLRDLRAGVGGAATSERRALGRAVHALYTSGAILIRRRENWQELYDLAARILPEAGRRPLPSEERLHALARRTLHILAPVTRTVWSQVLGALGSRAKLGLEVMKQEKRRLMGELLSQKEAILIQVEEPPEWYVLPADWEAVLADPPYVAAPRVSFLSDLDPVIWDRQRARDLFGFDCRRLAIPNLESHSVACVLPILYGAGLIGRLHCQMSWSSQRLLVHAIQIVDQALLADQHFRLAFSAALEGLALFHGARAIAATAPLPPHLLP